MQMWREIPLMGATYADHDCCKDSTVCVRVGGWGGAWSVCVIVCVCVFVCFCVCVCVHVCVYMCVWRVCVVISRNSQNFCGYVWHDSFLCVVRRTHRCDTDELNHPYHAYGTHVNEYNAYGISRHICDMLIHMCAIGVIRMSWIIHTTHMAHMWMNSITHMANVAGNTICVILIHACAI